MLIEAQNVRFSILHNPSPLQKINNMINKETISIKKERKKDRKISTHVRLDDVIFWT